MKTKNDIKQAVVKGASAIGLVSFVAFFATASVLASSQEARANLFFSPAVQSAFSSELELLNQLANPEQTDESLAEQVEQVAMASMKAVAMPVGFQTVDHTQPLTAGQQEVATWISKRYRVSRQAIESMVRVAWQVGREEKVEPTLILAISGIESSYNPFAASSVGAKGLMQVMAHIHKDKFEALSPGNWNPLNPELNMRVGSKIIREYTRRTGSVREGLRWYVGAAIHGNDGGYPDKVLGLKQRIDSVYAKGAVVARTEPSDKQEVSAAPSSASNKG